MPVKVSIYLAAVMIAVLGLVRVATAQDSPAGDSPIIVPVGVDLKGGLRTDMQILVRGDRAYVPITPLFEFLKIPVAYNDASARAEGEFLRPGNAYVIDLTNLSATLEGRTVAFSRNDYETSGGDLYLHEALFAQIFGVDVKYNPRRLELTVKTKLRLPVFQARDREYARRRRRALGKLPEPDISIDRRFVPLGFGRIGYSLSSQLTQFGGPRRTYALQVGNQLLGGDMDTRIFGTVGRALTKDNVLSRLRYAFLDNSYVRQIYLGDILTAGLLPSSVFGAEITNRPAPRRYFFTSDYISGPLPSGGVADLYYGGAIVDYQSQGATGEYSFPAIVPYGVSMYDVKSYDEFGLERVTNYRIVVPASMIPPGEFQYSLAGGILRQRDDEGYGNGTLQWGVNSRLTLGAGMDYYEKTARKYHPLLTATSRISDILTGDFTLAPSAFSRGLLSISWPSSASASFRYTWYARNAFYNPRNLRTEAVASLSIPIRPGSRRFSLDLSGRQSLLVTGRQRSAQVSFGGQLGIFTPRITTRRVWDDISTTGTRIEGYTTASLGIRAPGGFLFRSSTRYYHYDGGFRDARFEFSRRFSKGFWLQLFYERSFFSNNTFAGLQFVLYFPFALLRAVVGASEEGGLRSSQTISGSVGYSPETGDFYFDYLASRVGFGGIVVQPYVDANGNDLHDPGEEYVTKGRLKTTSLFGNTYVRYTPGGFLLDRTLPFEEYFMSLEPQFLDNPLWVPRYNTFSVISEPNQFLRIQLPIVVGGILRGRVTYDLAGQTFPAENLTVSVVPEGGEKEGYPKTSLSFSTGEFEFIGLPPGRYVVSLNQNQVSQLGYRNAQLTQTVEIRVLPEGDEVNNINFRLER
jgi:hypothetical protein